MCTSPVAAAPVLERPSRDAAAAGPPQILVVDDDPIIRVLIVRILRAEGFRTHAVTSAEAAMEFLETDGVDLILLDVGLPGIDGFELCRRIRSSRRLNATPVIFLSACDETTDRIRGFEAGGVDYITKPFHGDEVLARVRIHLRLEQARRVVMAQVAAQLEELRDAQRSLLVTPEELPDAGFAVCYRPLAAVGGDFYDVLRLGEGVYGYFAGDVSGHGVESSFLTGAVKTTLRQYASPVFTPEDTLQRMNTLLRATMREGHYLTACYVRYSRARRSWRVVSAGHPAPIRVPRSGRAETFDVTSDPLGIFDSVILFSREIPASPGDRLYLFTDGAIEDPGLPGGGRAIGVERLCQACERVARLDLAAAVTAVADGARPMGGAAADDLLILATEAAC
jgi:sigma-B regulation protein RsbU (phosphoserine phosphatase)